MGKPHTGWRGKLEVEFGWNFPRVRLAFPSCSHASDICVSFEFAGITVWLRVGVGVAVSAPKRKWKDGLLASGMPLEYSVIQVFEELGDWSPAEHRFRRPNEDGDDRLFSIDVHSTHIDVERNVFLEALVECKYRRDNTRWVFAPHEYDDFFDPAFCDVFLNLDDLAAPRKVDRQYLNKFKKHYPLGRKGVELMHDNTPNLKSIEQAVHQARYATVDRAASALVHQVQDAHGKPSPVYTLVPIIVTTAELYRVRPKTGIDEIRKAKDVDDIADREDILVLHDNPDVLATEHARRLVGSTLSTHGISLQGTLDRTSYEDVNDLLWAVSRRVPSMFVIIQYKRFGEAMSRLRRFVLSPSFLVEGDEQTTD